jgi:hypothetical protein
MFKRASFAVGVAALSVGFALPAAAAAHAPVACHNEGTGHSDQGVTFEARTVSFTLELTVTCKAGDPALQSGLLKGDGSGQLSCTGGTFAGKATVVWGSPASNRTSRFTYSGRVMAPKIEVQARIVGGSDYVGDHFDVTGTISAEHPEACAGEGVHNLSFNEEATITSPPPPEVAEVSPKQGRRAGGTCVTITGTNLDFASAVKFGTASAASFTVNSATSITAVAPRGRGIVDVTVTTDGGTSAVSPADRFSYAGHAPRGCPRPRHLRAEASRRRS